MKFCTSCGNQLGNEKFCTKCGAPVQDTSPTMASSTMTPSTMASATRPSSTKPSNGMQSDNMVENFNLFTAWTSQFKKYAKFSGRSRRSEFWLAYLANIIIVVIFEVLSVLFTASGLSSSSSASSVSGIGIFFSVLLIIYAIVIFLPQWTMLVRRLHDTGHSGWYLLLSLIPLVGTIVLLVFYLSDSQYGTNTYGRNPKGLGDNY